MKMPAFQFYPADWRKDPGVQALDFHDRGVWFEILCIMHESSERGVLLLNGRPMPEPALARMLGLDNQTLNQTLTNLLTYGVASQREQDGALYSRRMVKDENLCQVRREAGKKGGNPNLVKQNPTTGDNQISTPSSSSSISSSSSSEINSTSSFQSEVEAPQPEKKIEEVQIAEPLPESSTTELRTPGGAAEPGSDIADKADTVKLTKQRGGQKLKPEPGSANPADYELPEWAGSQFVSEFGSWLSTRQSRTDCKPLTAKAVQARLKELSTYDEAFCSTLFRQAEQNPHWQGLTFDNTPHKFTQHVLSLQKLHQDAARQSQPERGAKPTENATIGARTLSAQLRAIREQRSAEAGSVVHLGSATGTDAGLGSAVPPGVGAP